MIFDSTVGGASANSYLTVARANEINEARIFADKWTSRTNDEKQALLVTATRTINAICYKLGKLTTTQALKFPATGDVDEDLTSYIRLEIELATAEWAYQLGSSLTSDKSIETTLQSLGLKRLKADVVEFEFNPTIGTDILAKNAVSLLPASVMQFIPREWLCDELVSPTTPKARARFRFY